MSVDIGLIAAFTAGIGSFFSPCILPIVPTYISYLVGDYAKAKEKNSNLSIVAAALSFIIGFTIIFVLLGMTATFIAKFLIRNQRIFTTVGGLLIIIFGLHLTGIMEIKYFYRQKKLELPDYLNGNLRAFVMGVILSLGWTPCMGPVLSSILIVAGSRSAVMEGGILLLVFSIGLAIPFLLTALFVENLIPQFRNFNKYLPMVNKIAGILLIIFGLLMLTGYLEVINRILLS
ncbi:MAG: cytochrome c biogenesis CcdA family protein [Bacillota bacterium]